MGKSRKTKPTDAELAILHVLWESGACTVRQVQEQLEGQRGTGYTTTLKLMQIMLEKGLLRRDESAHAHVYQAAITRKKTQRQMVGQLLDQVFNGSAQQLVMQALSARKSTPEELVEIRKMIDAMENESQED